jgi:rubrerythrin
MVLLKPLVNRLLNSDDGEVVYECRNCGTSLDNEQDACPNCDSDDTVCHELS